MMIILLQAAVNGLMMALILMFLMILVCTDDNGDYEATDCAIPQEVMDVVNAGWTAPTCCDCTYLLLMD